MSIVYVALALVVVSSIAVLLSYNRFVDQRQLIANSWSNVDAELQRRHDLIPNLVETVRGYAGHEQRTFEMVTAARAQAMSVRGSAATQSPAENTLVAGMRQLLAVSEAYPDLRASYHFLQLQEELVTTENRIQAARRVYNGNVRDYNRRVDSIPSLMIARLFRFTLEEYFEVEPIVRDAPTVAFNNR
ncbi:MAG TPA: LemA family protein [Acidimicrobiales bacterium]|nr:LemA family protein [Acidimicrobiales bacterium]